jgi:hypothetical protein
MRDWRNAQETVNWLRAQLAGFDSAAQSAPMRELIKCDRYLRERFAQQFKRAESLEKK